MRFIIGTADGGCLSKLSLLVLQVEDQPCQSVLRQLPRIRSMRPQSSKFAGTLLPALPTQSWPAAFVLGLSMAPRAEITLVIMEHTLELGLASHALFSSMVLASVLSSVAGAMLLHWGIARLIRPQEAGTA